MEGLTEATKSAITQVIAQQILAGLGTEARDELLTNSITVTLKDWNFRSAIEKVVAEEGTKAAVKLLASPGWQSKIAEAVEDGAAEFVARLKIAMELGMERLLVGKSGDAYSRTPGLIFELLAEQRRAEAKG